MVRKIVFKLFNRLSLYSCYVKRMVLRVKQIAAIVGEEVVILPDRKAGDLLAILTNLEGTNDEDPCAEWHVNVTIGEGLSARRVRIELPPLLSREELESSSTIPVIVPRPVGSQDDLQLALFREKLFSIEPVPRNDSMRDEAALRVKREAYAKDAEVASLRSYVANIEAAIAYQSGPKREPIPDDVKMLVWTRDGGACIRCGNKSDLHFDHIIPVAKGGSNITENIQLLCKPRNLHKSDKIAF